MITFYKNSVSGLITLAEPISGCWINALDPTPDELEQLRALGLPADYLHYPLDIDERARTERENGTVLIILRVPFSQGPTADVPFITVPLGIILNDDYVVSICRWDNEILREFTAGRARGLATAKRYRFVLRILLTTASAYLRYLRDITKVVDALEDELQQSTRNREVLELLKYQKSLTYFTTALRSNQLMMERLQRSEVLRTYPEDEDLLEDVITENQQAIEMTSITSNILSSMMDAFASIISNNLNAVMKFLASITIVLSIPPIVGAFYGMNVALPLAGWPHAFSFVVGLAVIAAVVTIVIFWRRDWF